MNIQNLIPAPKVVSNFPGAWKLPVNGTISLALSDEGLQNSAHKLCGILSARTHSSWSWIASHASAGGTIQFVLSPCVQHVQGYELVVDKQGVQARASTPEGLFYAAQTLLQLINIHPRRLPHLEIVDWPDYERRGFYLDISRGKVPKLATILDLVDRLAALKINEFQLYVENVFKFRAHPDFYRDTTPLTAAEIRQIDTACRHRHIDFVPSLTSLGHFDKILRLGRYRRLAEIEPGDLAKQGIKPWSDDPWTLNVSDPKSRRLLAGMYDEFLPNFSSSLMNICCDEPWDLGKGKSRAKATKLGTGRIYVDWIGFCAGLAARHGKRVQLWADIIIKHPDLVSELPKDAILLEWGYEFDHPFPRHGRLLAASRRAFYICPGTSSWQSLGGRNSNSFTNIRSAARAGLSSGAVGLLNTDWGDYGHQQMSAVSLLPSAAGAALAWNVNQTDRSIIQAAAVHVLHSTAQVAQAVFDLGNVSSRISGKRIRNASLEFFLFREPWEKHEKLKLLKINRLKPEINGAKKMIQIFSTAAGKAPPDQKWIFDELSFTARLLLHVLLRTDCRLSHSGTGERSKKLWAKIMATQAADIRRLSVEFRTLWLARNKRSRLDDVLAHFRRLEKEYRSRGS
ncbi:MAG TPA: glycoside hydrolase family 20 zincin-like fold domain-containing protein [Phycisphaerae bacterium]|nr:glycoside hydrolase family 20 zincin-like fold domain-containing protein [Phycisphaerae bacterium]